MKEQYILILIFTLLIISLLPIIPSGIKSNAYPPPMSGSDNRPEIRWNLYQFFEYKILGKATPLT
jgi:hypothetical protein